MPKKNEPELTPKPYVERGNIEAHIIADMLRIESITAELREFKEVTKDRLNKLESWIIAIVGLTFASETFISLIIPFAAGGFIYIAGSDLIPELHKECGPKDSFWHIFALLLGVGLMVALKFIVV